MAIQISISNAIGAIDVIGSSVDPDAQAFITAASITDPTQQAAINTLVVDLKGYSIWTKFKAIYPIVGGTASSHAVNLKTPGTYNLSFASGWTHSSNGMQPNGTSAYADTNLKVDLIAQNSGHLSYYSRSNTAGGVGQFKVEVGYTKLIGTASNSLLCISRDNASFGLIHSNTLATSATNADTRGFYIANRSNSTVQTLDKNGSVSNTSNDASVTPTPAVMSYWIGGRNSPDNAGIVNYTDRQCAFSSIGDGLTSTERANFYTAVQAFQTTLGRSIGTQTVSDADAQAFVTAAAIDDQVQANAINNLVIGMKADGLWTKMKAIYPIVGGSASSHKFNLKDPRDLDAAFRLTFASGWTHSATGMTPLNTFANTFFNPNSGFSTNDNVHLSYYSRTNSNGTEIEIGSATTVGGPYLLLEIRTSGTTYYIMNSSGSYATASDSDSRAFYIGNRIGTAEKGFRNNTNVISRTSTATPRPNFNIYLGAFNAGGTASTYTTKQCAFASIGDDLTDTEATNYYNRVQTYQTTLERQV